MSANITITSRAAKAAARDRDLSEEAEAISPSSWPSRGMLLLLAFGAVLSACAPWSSKGKPAGEDEGGRPRQPLPVSPQDEPLAQPVGLPSKIGGDARGNVDPLPLPVPQIGIAPVPEAVDPASQDPATGSKDMPMGQSGAQAPDAGSASGSSGSGGGAPSVWGTGRAGSGADWNAPVDEGERRAQEPAPDKAAPAEIPVSRPEAPPGSVPVPSSSTEPPLPVNAPASAVPVAEASSPATGESGDPVPEEQQVFDLADLMENLREILVVMPDETVGQIVDHAVGDLVREVPFERLLEHADSSGTEIFGMTVTRLEEIASRETLGFEAVAADTAVQVPAMAGTDASDVRPIFDGDFGL